MKTGTREYLDAHLAVARKFGKAAEYPCFTGCCHPALDWACWGDYGNVDEYVPMCRSCHSKMDDKARHWKGVNRKKSHCPKGHEYTPENTWLRKDGSQFCQICNREKARAYRAAARARQL